MLSIAQLVLAFVGPIRKGARRGAVLFRMTLPSSEARAAQDKPSWSRALRVYLEPASLRMLSLGFSAGLPLLLVFGTLSFWLREAGVDHWFSELGGPGVRLQMGMVSPGRPHAHSRAHPPAGAQAQLACAGANDYCWGLGLHVAMRPAAGAGAHGLVCAGGCRRVCNPGHCA